MGGGQQLSRVTSTRRGAVQEVEVWIHGLGLPEVRPLHRGQNTVLEQRGEDNESDPARPGLILL